MLVSNYFSLPIQAHKKFNQIQAETPFKTLMIKVAIVAFSILAGCIPFPLPILNGFFVYRRLVSRAPIKKEVIPYNGPTEWELRIGRLIDDAKNNSKQLLNVALKLIGSGRVEWGIRVSRKITDTQLKDGFQASLFDQYFSKDELVKAQKIFDQIKGEKSKLGKKLFDRYLEKKEQPSATALVEHLTDSTIKAACLATLVEQMEVKEALVFVRKLEDVSCREKLLLKLVPSLDDGEEARKICEEITDMNLKLQCEKAIAESLLKKRDFEKAAQFCVGLDSSISRMKIISGVIVSLIEKQGTADSLINQLGFDDLLNQNLISQVVEGLIEKEFLKEAHRFCIFLEESEEKVALMVQIINAHFQNNNPDAALRIIQDEGLKDRFEAKFNARLEDLKAEVDTLMKAHDLDDAYALLIEKNLSELWEYFDSLRPEYQALFQRRREQIVEYVESNRVQEAVEMMEVDNFEIEFSEDQRVKLINFYLGLKNYRRALVVAEGNQRQIARINRLKKLDSADL